MNDIVIIISKKHLYYNGILEKKFSVSSPYKFSRFPLRIIQTFLLNYLNNPSFFYKSLNNIITDSTKYLLLFESSISATYIKYISEKFPKIHIIVFYTNVVNKINISLINSSYSNKVTFVSFDRRDSKLYNMYFLSDFYFNDWVKTQQKTKYDIMFVGKDKGRRKELLEIKAQYKKMGLKTYFYIVSDNRIKQFLFKRPKKYKSVLKLISTSRCILEMNLKNQEGFSLRVLESLFHKKKLITNNLSIRNEPFYDKRNIFLTNVDSINELNNFVDSDYYENNYELFEYEFNGWIKRIVEYAQMDELK